MQFVFITLFSSCLFISIIASENHKKEQSEVLTVIAALGALGMTGTLLMFFDTLSKLVK